MVGMGGWNPHLEVLLKWLVLTMFVVAALAVFCGTFYLLTGDGRAAVEGFLAGVLVWAMFGGIIPLGVLIEWIGEKVENRLS